MLSTCLPIYAGSSQSRESLEAFGVLVDWRSSHHGGQGKSMLYLPVYLTSFPLSQASCLPPNLPSYSPPSSPPSLPSLPFSRWGISRITLMNSCISVPRSIAMKGISFIYLAMVEYGWLSLTLLDLKMN